MGKLGAILNGYIIPRKLTSHSRTHIGNYLRKTCESVESVPIGWLVTGPNKQEYYISPYKLWRPKGMKGKSWYHYKDVESLVEKHLSRIMEKDNVTSS